MRIRVDNVGTVGVVQDIPGYELPANAWTLAQNIRMQDGSVRKANGYADLWTRPEVAPYFLYPVQTPSAYYWLYCGLNDVYTIQNNYHFRLTRTSGQYNASTAQRWNGTNLGGVIVLNNGVDVPQFWQFPISHANNLQDLTAWPSTDRCRVMRAYKNFLVAFNITRSGSSYPSLVKWSHSADVGTVPTSWSISDPTLDSGETDLPQEGGEILDARALRDITVIYRNEATWAMQFIGAPAIFRFWSIFDNSGILATDCVSEFHGSHFVVTGDDIVVHDGQSLQSVANNRVRRSIFADMDTTYYDRSFVVHNKADKEMWLCYPSTGSTLADRAWVWSYAENTWAKRSLPSISHAAYGVLDSEASDSWEAARGSWTYTTGSWASASGSWTTEDVAWSADNNPWNYRTYDAQLLNVIFADPTNTRLYQGDYGNTNNGSAMSSRIERTGLALIGPEKIDLYSRKHIRAIYPHIEGQNGSVVKCYAGWQDSIDATVTWSTAKEYTIGSSYKVDFNIDGRLIAVAFESTTDLDWRLTGYEIDMEVSGSA